MAKNKKNIIIGVIFIFSLFIVFLIYSRFFKKQDLVHPKTGDIVESIYGLGTVSPDSVFRVRAGVSLTVRKLFVKEGDLIHVNDPLVQLDESVMRSPIDGTVTAVSTKLGELITPQVAIVTVTNLSRLYLEVSLEQQSVLRIKKDQDVVISFESLREEKYQGKVFSIYPRDNQFIVRIELSEWPHGVLPGMTADVAILVGKKTNVLMIPLKSIVSGKVIRYRQGHKETLPVQLGIVDGEWGEVLSNNLTADDELFIRK